MVSSLESIDGAARERIGLVAMRTSVCSNSLSDTQRSMTVHTGTLVFVAVYYFRCARYCRRHQAESHRTPRYRVQYQLEGEPTQEAWVGPNPRQYLVADIRASHAGDIVEVTLTEDGHSIVDWVNKTNEEFWSSFDGTLGECD